MIDSYYYNEFIQYLKEFSGKQLIQYAIISCLVNGFSTTVGHNAMMVKENNFDMLMKIVRGTKNNWNAY